MNNQLNQEKVETARRGFLGFFIRRYRLAYLLALGIVIWGGFAAITLPREANPEVKVPFGIVTTIYPGASPADVEDQVTNEVEEKVKNLDNVKEVTSSSSLSISTVSVEFEAEADLEKSIQDLKDAVDEITTLPDTAEDPQVFDVNFNNLPILTISLVGNLTDLEFRELGEEVQSQLEDISGVSEVSLSGTRPRVINVIVNQEELRRNRINLTQIVGALNQGNINSPVGDIEVGGANYNIRLNAKFESTEELKSLVVAQNQGTPILLGDVANVRDELKQTDTISRIALRGQKPEPAISLQLAKKTGGNIIEIVDAAKARLTELQADGTIPSLVQVEITNDNSQFIRNDLGTLSRSGIQTVIVIFILLTLALTFRQAVLGALVIPLVFFMSLGIIALTGGTLNSLTLFALVLSLGLLVDTMIVLMEGIYDGLRQGFHPREAALYSLETYKWPVTSGVLTTIAAFIPMLLVSGIVGEFLKTFPITVAAALGSSLFISLIVMPPVVARLLVKQERSTGEPIQQKPSLLERWVDRMKASFYSEGLKNILKSKRKKWGLTISAILLVVISIGAVAGGLIPVTLFPVIDFETLFVDIELPPGSTLEQTNVVATQAEKILLEVPEVKNFVTALGAGQLTTFEGDFGSGGNSSENTGQIVINLVDEGERDIKSYNLAPILREKFRQINGAKVELTEATGGPPTGSPIEVRILGDDLTALADTANVFKHELENTPGVINVTSDNRATPPEFAFTLNPETLGRFGLSAAQVGANIRAGIQGVEATTLNIDGDDIDVIVKFNEKNFTTTEELRNINLITPSGAVVKLDQVANFEIVPALESIRHRDLERLVNVRADTEGANSQRVITGLQEKLPTLNVPSDVKVEFGGEVEEIQESFTELWYSMSVAVLLIFLIMVLQFNSFKQPLIIMVTLPFAVIGVVFGTFILGLDFGFATFLGIVALAGIVVNDAIILIDRMNYNVSVRRLKISEAASEAGEARLQPVIMTTLTTIAGVTPLAFVDEFWRGLSVAVAFGILFATVLTLIFIPMFYVKFEGKRWLKKGHRMTE